MKRFTVTVVVLAIVAVSAGAYYNLRRNGADPQVTTAPVTRGDITDAISATGTLGAVTTVQVGTQVSGTIADLHADFNSIVRERQVIARLDPSLFQTQIEQARANLVRAEADVERLKVSVEDARRKLTRAEGLAAKNLIPETELETARVTLRAAEAQLKSSEASAIQARASLNQSEVNLQHTVIRAPIDGIVISRNVDVGQTVAASMQAPTLFVLAADLTKMQVTASIDEADVGRIRPGQRVRFRVDAHPTEEFEGRVSQVRLQPVVVQNVVTYATVIDVPNPELKLKPGMTANVTIEIARRLNVLRVPNASLRFRPTVEIYAALKQSPPSEAALGARAASEGGRPTAGQQDGRGAEQSGLRADGRSQQSQVGTDRGSSRGFSRPDRPGVEGGDGPRDPDGRRRFAERLQSMNPEERERMLQRMRERGFDQNRRLPAVAEPERSARRDGRENRPGSATPPDARSAKTIDSLFGPLPMTETAGRLYLYPESTRQLKPVRVRLGVSDGSFTELLGDELQAGALVVTAVTLGNEDRRPTSRSPFQGPQRGPGGPGGGGVRNPGPQQRR